jgi:hypothetical protein
MQWLSVVSMETLQWQRPLVVRDCKGSFLVHDSMILSFHGDTSLSLFQTPRHVCGTAMMNWNLPEASGSNEKKSDKQ